MESHERERANRTQNDIYRVAKDEKQAIERREEDRLRQEQAREFELLREQKRQKNEQETLLNRLK